MRSTFFGLQIGLRSLRTQQRSLDVTSHNIANANTPGYTRQEAIMVTTPPYPVPALDGYIGAGQIGTGVEVSEIRRMRDRFLDYQMRSESKILGYWEAQQDALEKIEGIINEPSDSGLRSIMEDFWIALDELAKDPESLAARSLVVETGRSLADAFNHIDTQLSELVSDLNRNLKVMVDDINSMARQIADLNMQILKVEVSGARANDLRDKRDLLVDRLAKTINIKVVENENGTITVNISGRALVQGENANKLVVGNSDDYPEIYWQDDQSRSYPLTITGGTVRGIIDARGYKHGEEVEGFIPALQKQMDILAKGIAEAFNEIHRIGAGLNGDTGLDFFMSKDGSVSITAGNIAVNQELSADPSKVAAAELRPILDDPDDYENKIELNGTWYTWDKGDGSNALQLAKLKETQIIDINSTQDQLFSPDDYYNAIIGELGVTAQQAYRMVENQELLVSQIENNRLSVSGVSLDEEMVNMIRFQHAYNAAARVITTMDEMIDLIINRMGLVGR
ncbi:MAG: flagellar hook-associated protein FlgK [Thermacetogeniaceae bacterium]|nr:flagellar hook-associated protein FlgK [Thermoanaerobacterales bacterium]NLN21670.1 flagellar hook-associated protein FlgK [Syntrophomonadaceae bacterium]HAF17335.1 flagellar hook-associated protein FlgK [Peptococcaceae bacterium]